MPRTSYGSDAIFERDVRAGRTHVAKRFEIVNRTTQSEGPIHMQKLVIAPSLLMFAVACSASNNTTTSLQPEYAAGGSAGAGTVTPGLDEQDAAPTDPSAEGVDAQGDSADEGQSADSLGEKRATYYVDGSVLRDPCGEALVLRGVNKGSAFPAGDRDQKYVAEVAKTGANAVRYTLRMIYSNSTAEDVEIALQKAHEHNMVAIPAIWDATGDWSKLDEAVGFWLQPDVLAVLKEHEDHVILNIANEAGTKAVTDEQFRAGYRDAIAKLRDAGLNMPLMIDAAHWGRGENYFLDNGEYLLDQDPDRNLIFSWHPWDTNQPASRYEEAFIAAKEKGLNMVVGEFASLGVEYDSPIDFRAILDLSEKHEIGWLWWWWRSEDGHALTPDGIYGNWVHDGEEVVVTHENGLEKTAQRTYFQEHGTCQ